MATLTQFQTTTDANTIQEWAEVRGGTPAIDPQNNLRIIFDEDTETTQNLRKISWEDFFENFQENVLQFLYQEESEDNSLSMNYQIVKQTEGESNNLGNALS